MTDRVTAQNISEILTGTYEDDDFPDKVIGALREFEGKKLTKRILPHLPGGAEKWRLIDSALGVELVHRDFRLVVTGVFTGEKCPIIDCNDIEKRNPGYYAGRRERNKERIAAKNDKFILSVMANAINRVREGHTRLAKSEAVLDSLTGGGGFSADRYVWKEMAEKKGDE